MVEVVVVGCKMEIKKTIILASVLAVLTFLAFIPFISADPSDYATCQGYGMMNEFFGGYGLTLMLIYWIIIILVIALIIAAVYWLIKSANKKK
jgi:uncharacterized membrane protein